MSKRVRTEAYSFYPINDSDDDTQYSYSNGYLFERRRASKNTNETPTTGTCTATSSTTSDTAIEATTSTLPTEKSFCHCGNCADLPSVIERKCCTDESLNMTNLQDSGFVAGSCILNSKLLTDHVLGTVTLQLQWFRQQRYIGLRGDSLLFTNMTNTNYRFHAYRSYIDFIHGYLGKSNRRVIPSCIITHIRGRWPNPDNNYVGYKEIIDIDEDTEPQPDADEVEQFLVDAGD